MIYGRGGSKVLTRNVEVPEADEVRFCINDEEVLKLAGYAITIEDHYSNKYKKPRPMDIEWAKDGITGELFIVQARPETVQSQKSKDILETYVLEERLILAKGRSVGDKIASGKAHVIPEISDLPSFKPGEILIADYNNSGLGACNENSSCNYHEQRRKNFPCCYCQQRTGNSRSCGNRQCNRSS